MNQEDFLQILENNPSDKQLKKKDFIFTLDNRRAILTVSPRGHKATTKKTLQALLDIRYNNVQVRLGKTFREICV